MWQHEYSCSSCVFTWVTALFAQIDLTFTVSLATRWDTFILLPDVFWVFFCLFVFLSGVQTHMNIKLSHERAHRIDPRINKSLNALFNINHFVIYLMKQRNLFQSCWFSEIAAALSNPASQRINLNQIREPCGPVASGTLWRRRPRREFLSTLSPWVQEWLLIRCERKHNGGLWSCTSLCSLVSCMSQSREVEPRGFFFLPVVIANPISHVLSSIMRPANEQAAQSSKWSKPYDSMTVRCYTQHVYRWTPCTAAKSHDYLYSGCCRALQHPRIAPRLPQWLRSH